MINWLTAYTLWQREIVRFYRQPNRVIGALGSPLIFWLLIGSGVGRSFGAESGGYLTYFFPGTILMILLFTAIFSTISIIEDRKEGFLQAVLVAPASRWSIVLGKVAGGATLAVMQGLLFLLAAPFIGLKISAGALILLLIVMILLSFSLTAAGFLLAWNMDSVQGFHALMNLLLLPMWLLSGALFPPEGAVAWLRVVMYLNPLFYGLVILRSFWQTGGTLVAGHPALGLCWVVTVGFAALVFGASILTASINRVRR